jgi:hypothetical protein
MMGKEQQVIQGKSGEPSASRNLATPSSGLPNIQSSSGGSRTANVDGGVAEMMGRLKLTVQESTPFVLEDGEDDLDCPEWALFGKVLAPNTLHISTIQSALRPAWGNPRAWSFVCMVPTFSWLSLLKRLIKLGF